MDDWFSRCVREAANWTCERCGTYYSEGARQGLHCSHLFGRRRLSVRYAPDNAVAHCFTCHQILGENPLRFASWIRQHLGEEKTDLLEERANTIIRLKAYHKKQILENLKASHADLLEQRRQGITGRLTFESPYPEELFRDLAA